VIALESEKNAAAPEFGRYKLFLEKGQGSVTLEYGRDWIVVSGLEPGIHAFDRLQFVYKSAAGYGRMREVTFRFELEPGKATILGTKFRLFHQKSGGTWYQRIRWRILRVSERRALIDELEKDPNFGRWRFD